MFNLFKKPNPNQKVIDRMVKAKKANEKVVSAVREAQKVAGKKRPKCEYTEGCTKLAQNQNTTENPRWRKTHGKHICHSCHVKRLLTLVKKDKSKKKHYTEYRKDCCENQDGRLGFKCTYVNPSPEQLSKLDLAPDFKGYLQVDHIDGDSSNNNPENLQTLCANCHTIKTNWCKDYATRGRTKIKRDLDKQKKVA